MPTEEHTGHSNKLPQRTEERSNISKRKHMNESSVSSIFAKTSIRVVLKWGEIGGNVDYHLRGTTKDGWRSTTTTTTTGETVLAASHGQGSNEVLVGSGRRGI